MTRRELIHKIAIGGTTLMVMPSVLESCTKAGSGFSDLTIDLTKPGYSSLKNPGGYIITGGVIIANTGDDQFVALSGICTHQSCTVGYSFANNDFRCPCHGSVFSVTGSVINGPASSALRKYTITRTGDILTITA